jgi:hypothetical protein
MTTKEILDTFVKAVDVEKTYTSAELVKILKSSAKGSVSKGENGEPVEKTKKAPSAYNLFVKDFMLNPENEKIPPKDRMKAATVQWKQQKETSSVPVAA